MQALSNRIRELMKQHELLTEKELSLHTGVPQPTINRILTGATKTPRKSALKALSAYFKVPLQTFLESNDKNDLIKDEPGTRVPLFEWSNIPEQINLLNQKKCHPQHILSFKKLEGKLFALVVSGAEFEPRFSKGTILIFKSDKLAKNRDYILLHSDTASILKQILIDGNDTYVKSLNVELNYPIVRLDSLNDITGVLVQSISEFGD
jgi:SOS-response transcriptional repressor LexA